MKFPDLQAADDWLRHPDYQALVQHCKRAARANLVTVDGIV